MPSEEETMAAARLYALFTSAGEFEAAAAVLDLLFAGEKI